jgi:drug/metabolite transporter (DMT)-like permease
LRFVYNIAEAATNRIPADGTLSGSESQDDLMTITAPPDTDARAAMLGTMLVALSAILWSAAGLFTKAATVDAWGVIFWRSVFSVLPILLYVRWKDGPGQLAQLRRMGPAGWAVVLVGAAATYCFITAFKHTSIANVATFYACTPFLAAAIGWLLFRERTSRVTLLAAMAALAGVLIMVWGSLGTPNLVGDGLGIAMAIGMATLMVLIRRYPEEPMVLAAVISGVITGAVATLFTDPTVASARDLWILAGFGLAFAAAHIMLTEGARLIPAARTGLVGTLETPLAPIWAWLILSELPPFTTWVGGAIVLAAVIWNLRRER